MGNEINESYARFQKIIDDKGITAYKVAKETGVTTATLTSWKQGKYVPKTEKMQKIAKFLGTTEEYILTGKEKSNSNDNKIVFKPEHMEIIELYEKTDKRTQGKLMDIIRIMCGDIIDKSIHDLKQQQIISNIDLSKAQEKIRMDNNIDAYKDCVTRNDKRCNRDIDGIKKEE